MCRHNAAARGVQDDRSCGYGEWGMECDFAQGPRYEDQRVSDCQDGRMNVVNSVVKAFLDSLEHAFNDKLDKVEKMIEREMWDDYIGSGWECQGWHDAGWRHQGQNWQQSPSEKRGNK